MPWNADQNDIAQLLREIREDLRALRSHFLGDVPYDPASYDPVAAIQSDKELVERALEGSEAEKQGFKAK